MAMSRQSWSINALATEFNLDRRTVGKRLEHVLPCDLGPDGSPRWRMNEAAPALLRFVDPPAKPMRPVPQGCEILQRIPNQVHAGFVTAWLELFANFQWLVAGPLMASGLTKQQSEKAIGWMFVTLMTFADNAAKNASIPPWMEEQSPSWMPSELVIEPDWKAAAAYAKDVKAEQAMSAKAVRHSTAQAPN